MNKKRSKKDFLQVRHTYEAFLKSEAQRRRRRRRLKCSLSDQFVNCYFQWTTSCPLFILETIYTRTTLNNLS